LIDNNVFFREATLRITGSLDIAKALHQFILYVKDIIPVEHIVITLYDMETGTAEAIAHTTLVAYQHTSIKIQIPVQGRNQIKTQRSMRLRRMKNTSFDPVAKSFCKYFDCLDLAGMVMDLVIEHKFLGVVAIFSSPGVEFNLEHEKLIASLNDPFAIAVSNNIRYRELRRYRELLEDDNKYLHKELRRVWGDEVIGAEFGLKNVMNHIHKVAPTDSPVLLLGATGVGKELMASTIHMLSSRHNGPFIDVNCGAIPNSLMDSELFGHEKGSFTGAASRRRGRFERAQGGTIFLDEIGELPPEAQVRLLRVLQEKTITRVGGTESIPLNIRVIAATHRNLESMMAAGTFREDLYFRLKVFPITIPPLKERTSDIPSLANHFVKKKSTQMKLISVPKISAEGMDRLIAYDWPGNVRELENAIERALILTKDKPLLFSEFSPQNSTSPQELHQSKDLLIQPGSEKSEFLNLNTVISRQIINALTIAEGKVEGKAGAADLLDINPRTLRNKMRKLGIPFGKGAMARYQPAKKEG
jgi:transcriptional regulator with GAF, ATPase, and Fis domain